MSDKLDDYVQTGIHGAKEVKKGERRQYLGTIRERVLFALTEKQVMKKEGLEQLEKELQAEEAVELLLNGELSYRFLTDYKKLANRYGVDYTTVSNLEVDTDLGIVLTSDQAVDKENIFLPAASDEKSESTEPPASFISRLKSLFSSGK